MANSPVESSTSNVRIDTHCHLHHDRPTLDVELDAAKLKLRCVLMSTCEEDWETVALYCRKYHHQLVPGFGIHPWWAHTATDGWDNRLEEYLKQFPTAVVGETGLDHVAKARGSQQRIDRDLQYQLFIRHLELAAKHRRPISVHLVKAFGKLHDLLAKPEETIGPVSSAHEQSVSEAKVQNAADVASSTKAAASLPPTVSLHSFGGTSEFATTLLKLETNVSGRIYFGFSSAINLRNREKTSLVLDKIPSQCILVESDRTCFRSAEALSAELDDVAQLIMACKSSHGQQPDLDANAQRWLDGKPWQ